MKYTSIVSVLVGVLASFISIAPAYAHVVVTPSRVGVSTTQIFSVSVPTEKNIPTTAIRLLIPSGVNDVTPTVKQGWTITTNKNGNTVSEIDWLNGTIPAGQRDEFSFKAQVPSMPTTLAWKAYQTYADGTVDAWIDEVGSKTQDPDMEMPYSITRVVSDLSGTPALPSRNPNLSEFSNRGAYILSILALVLSAVSLLLQLRKQKNKKG